MRFKYVIVQGQFGLEHVTMCDEVMTHAQLAGHSKVISAGFVDIDGAIDAGIYPDLSVHCYGESLSLGIKSRGKVDADLIERRR